MEAALLKRNQVNTLTLPGGLLRLSQRTMEFTRLAAERKLLLQDRLRRQRGDLEIAEELQTETCGLHGRLLPQIRPWDAEGEVEVM